MLLGEQMTNTYDFRLVALSVLIATIASYTALDLAGRVTAAQGKARIGWLTGGAIAMGTGIWSMHFVGMLAFCLPIPVEYDLLTVLISMLAAIGASGLALFLVSREAMGIVSLLGGSLFMGLGIATMHYTGMVAMRLQASIQYDWLLVTLSVAIAIAVSLVALWLAFKLREANTVAAIWRQIGSAIVMGAAVPSMHYTGMAAARFIPIANIDVVELRPTIDSAMLAIAISIATLLVLGIALLTSFFDRRMYAEVLRADALEQSEKRFRKLAQREELLNRLSSQIRNSLDFNTILSTAVNEIRSLLQIQRCRFLWYRADVEHPYFELMHEAGDPALANISSPDPLQEVAALGETILKLKIFLAADISKDSQLDKVSRNQLASLGLTSLLAVSIQTHTGRVGVVICENYNQLRPWSNNEVELIQAVALQLAIAINQAELYTSSRFAATTAQIQASQLEKALSELQQTQNQLIQSLDSAKVLGKVIHQIRSTLDSKTILQTIVREVHTLLQTDRVVIYQFNQDWVGEVVVEKVASDWMSVLGKTYADNCFPAEYAAKYQQGRVRAIDNVALSDLPPCHKEFLLNMQVKANLAVPIGIGEKLWGLLIAHECRAPREWMTSEIDLLQQLADQAAIAIQQAELYSQTRYAAAVAQDQASQLEKALSDLQQAQAQLVQTEKMSSLGQMVAGVAHEINNPVNFIYGNLQHTSTYIQDLFDLLHLYQQNFPDPGSEIEEKMQEIDLDFLIEDLPSSLSSMKVGASRIREIVLSLRNFSRLDEAEMKPVDIHEGIDSTLLILQHRLQQKVGNPGIQIIKKYGNLPRVECYAGQLNQVFMNILANAIDALEKKDPPRIITICTDIKSQESHSSVLIRIADNGLGMTEEVKKRLFDPFFTTKTVGNGTGLGLSISYQIVFEKHGGQLQCNSAPGQGAEFIMEIPIQQQERQSAFTLAVAPA